MAGGAAPASRGLAFHHARQQAGRGDHAATQPFPGRHGFPRQQPGAEGRDHEFAEQDDHRPVGGHVGQAVLHCHVHRQQHHADQDDQQRCFAETAGRQRGLEVAKRQQHAAQHDHAEEHGKGLGFFAQVGGTTGQHVGQGEAETGAQTQPFGRPGRARHAQFGAPQHGHGARQGQGHHGHPGPVQALTQDHPRQRHGPQGRKVEEQQHPHDLALEHAQNVAQVAGAGGQGDGQHQGRRLEAGPGGTEGHGTAGQGHRIGRQRGAHAGKPQALQQAVGVPDQAAHQGAGQEARQSYPFGFGRHPVRPV